MCFAGFASVPFRFFARHSSLAKYLVPVRYIAVALFVFGTATASLSQSSRGTIAGTILDPTGAAIEGATITATGVETGAVYNTTSTATGSYRIPDMQLGAYNITVSANGFKTSDQKGVVVQINTTSSLDVTLQVGDRTETLTVSADAPALQSESSDMGTIVDKRQIEDLPLALAASGQSHLRSAEAFVFLTPNTAGPGTASDNSSSGVFESKLAGGQNLGTEVILDGASIAHAELGPTFDENAPSIEAISEFKVTTSTLSPEFGRTSGGVESFTTKSGTNSYHGAGFDILHNDKLNAIPWSAKLPGRGNVKPTDHQNDFGGSLGGPVRVPKLYNGHDKTFFFFSWEQYRNNQGTNPNPTTLPTDAERQGDFSALLKPPFGTPTGQTNPCDGSAILVGQIFDPSTTKTVMVGGQPVQCRTAFPGNKITNLSPVAQKVLSYLQVHPDLPGTLNGLTNNFIYHTSIPIVDSTITFRIDQNWGNNDKFFFSYSSRDQEQLNGSPSIPPPLDQNFFKSRVSHYKRFGWDRTFSTTILNHLTIGLNRLYDPSRGESITGQDWPQTLGISGASGITFPVFTFNANNLNIGYQGFSASNADIAIPNSLIVADSLSWIRSRHALRFGFEWRASQYSRFNVSTSPNYGFFGSQTAFAPADANTGDPFASFLLGLPGNENLFQTSNVPRWNQYYYAAYVEDDFKFRKDLTFNLGFRYDVDTPRHEAHGAQSVLDLTAPNNGTTTGSNPIPISPAIPGALVYGSNATGAKTYYKDLGPRIGFAYAPQKLFGREWFRNTVIRGGYGIYYSALFYTDFGDGMRSGSTVNPSFSSPDNFSPVLQGGKGSLDTGFPSYSPPTNANDPALLNGGFQGSPNYAAPSYGRPGMVQNWSFELQHQFAPDLLFSIGYIGNHATRLNSNLEQLNAIDPKYFSLGLKLKDPVMSPQGQATLAGLGITSVPAWFEQLYGPSGRDLVGQLLLPFPQYQSGQHNDSSITTNCCLENLGQSTYNALEAKLERRFRNGLNLLASYTFSKTLTDADSAYAGLTAFNSSDTFNAQNPHDLRSEKALSYQDVPHMFVLSYLYELPVGKGKKFLNQGGVVDKVLGGWQIGGVQRYQKGVPFILYENDASGVGIAFGTPNPRLSLVSGQPLLASNASSYNPFAGGSGCTPNPDGTFTANGTNNFFNCAAFFDPNATNLVAQRGYAFGNAPKTFGNIRSPGYVNEDFSLIKRFTLYEAHVLSFKADFVNAFNRHTLGRGDGCVTCDTFGQPGSQFGGGPNVLNGQKLIQFTFRYQF